MGVPTSIGGRSLKASSTHAGTNGATPTQSKPTATMGIMTTPDIKEKTVALTSPLDTEHSSGFTNSPGIRPVKPTPIRSKIGVAGLKYPPKSAQSVFPIAPDKNPTIGPKSIPKTHGKKARILQCIAPGINGIGAVRRKPTPVTADVIATYATAVNGSTLTLAELIWKLKILAEYKDF
jgi:hypothetical protein